MPNYRLPSLPDSINISTLGDTTSTAVVADDNMDTSGKPKTYSSKTKRDEHGTYPAWMSKRKIQNP